MKQYISLATPLNGISTYKDTLNLETGTVTRKIRKYVLTGEETVEVLSSGQAPIRISGIYFRRPAYADCTWVCSHYLGVANSASWSNYDYCMTISTQDTDNQIRIRDIDRNSGTAADFKAFLAAQYAAGTPVTIWIYTQDRTETITLPHGLSGTVEGYTTQATTPTPSSPVYPTENYINSFLDKKYLKYETATNTITSLPKTIIGDGQPISAYTIKGNMTQSGTPTPSNPVYPTEVGDKTANLWNEDYPNIDNTIRYLPIQVGEGKFTISTTTPAPNNYACLFILAGNVSSGASSGTNGIWDGYNRTVTAVDGYITIAYRVYNDVSPVNYNTMLNAGETALSYEPSGYKIPISLSQNTYNIYITEPLRKSLDGSNVYDTIESNGTLTRRVDANGDALATPTTEQVTVPTLTTTGTAEQFNVLTTLAPSEVSLTYHGWHEHSDTKFTTP